MSEETKKAPVIRFKGFFDDWEQRKLEDLAESFNYGLNASAMEFDGENKYIRITDIDEQSHKFIQSGLTSPKTDLLNADDYLLKEGDILFARTGASVGKSYQYEPLDGKVYYAGFLIRARIKPEFDSRFIFQNTLTEKYNNFIKVTSQRSGQPGVNAQEYANFSILIPSRGEQVKLGNFFKQLDDTIALHQRKLTLLKCLKQMYLQKLFPQNGENIPALRFAGFTEIWDQRKLKDLYERNSEKNNGQFDSENTISIASMKFKPEGNGAAEESINSYKVLRMGDIAFEGHTSKLYSFGRFVLNDIGDGIMSPRFTTLRPKKEMYIPFWKQYIIYEPIMKHLLVKATKLGTMMNELVLEDFFNQFLLVPSDNEQQKIGSFFKQLDDIIDLHQCKLEILTELKQVLLAKMIV